MSQCPACQQEHGPQARFCSACGTPLVMRCPACDVINARTRDACHHCQAALHGPTTVIEATLDDAAPAPGWRLDLFDDLRPPAELPPLPVLDASIFVSDRDAPRMPPAEPPPAAAPAPPSAPPSPPALERAEARARRRAAVRRALGRRQMAPVVRDVLVLEADAAARAQLCAVLEVFGFRPHVAVSVAEAEGLSRRRVHGLALLGVGGDPDAAAALCRRLNESVRARPAVLIAVCDRDRHADRVRMQLAGADQTLMRPVSRGDLARAVEASGMALPQDPRLPGSV